MNWKLSNANDAFAFLCYWSYWIWNASLMIKVTMNNLDTLFSAMRNGKYSGFRDTKGNGYIGIINGIVREDGSGKNWIVTVSTNLKTEKVFIHAN